MKVLAVDCWVLAWIFAVLGVAAFLAVRGGRGAAARVQLAAGLAGAAGFALAGAALW